MEPVDASNNPLSPAQTRIAVVLGIAELPAFLSMWIGVYLSLAWRPGAYVLVGGLTALIAVHLARGLFAYHLVMSRPWPKVAPLTDDDDW